MKTTIIYFGILMMMANSLFANHSTEARNSAKIDFSEMVQSGTDTIVLKKPVMEMSFETDLTIDGGYKKTIEEIITEDNLVIESSISNEILPLDFERIYQNRWQAAKGKCHNGFSCKPLFRS